MKFLTERYFSRSEALGLACMVLLWNEEHYLLGFTLYAAICFITEMIQASRGGK